MKENKLPQLIIDMLEISFYRDIIEYDPDVYRITDEYLTVSLIPDYCPKQQLKVINNLIKRIDFAGIAELETIEDQLTIRIYLDDYED